MTEKVKNKIPLVKMTDTSEKGLEGHITRHLSLVNGFEERNYAQYNRTECVDEELLFRFLEDTQPQRVERLKNFHKENYRQKILYLVNRKIKDETVVNGKCLGGIINVLRSGITDGQTGTSIKLFFDKPVSSLNTQDNELYAKNIFSVTRQVRYSLKNEKSLDLVIFINGLPIITFELKNELTKQNVRDAIGQYKTTRDANEDLFRLARCLVHFAVDTEEVWMCTHLKGAKSNFIPFNKGHDHGAGNPPNPDGIKTDYLWKDILTKDNLSNLIANYLQFTENEEEKVLPDGKIKREKVKKMIFPRFHQLDAVKKLLIHARENSVGCKYLIQHSAGSGKSNTISWLAHQLVGLYPADANGVASKDAIFDSIIVVTDRIVLDSQIQKNVRQFEQTSGVVEHIDKGSKHLKQALEEGKKIIITTVQKFPFIVDEISELPGNRFAIIIDEAHSGQSGDTSGKMNATLAKEFERVKVDEDEYIFLDKDQHDELTSEDLVVDIVKNRKLLKNASYFAFTATPKSKTLELFGVKYKEGDKEKFRAFHLYSMKQAIEERFILDVLENYTTYNSYYGLLKKIKDNPRYDKNKAQKKLRVYVETHEHAIAKKAAVMISHFMESVIAERKINGLAKAMVVTGSRRSAVKYKKAFDKYLSEHGIPYKAIVAFSGEIDGATEKTLNYFPSANIPDEFRKAENRFLIVASKYQTGFDEPLLHTMFVDKKLGGVSAVQTLSRLNRTMAGKDNTFVMDFVNEADDIQKSFEPYYKTTILGEATDPNKLFDLQNALDNFHVYTREQVEEFSDKILRNVPIDQLHSILDEAVNIFKTGLDEKTQEDFRAKCKSYTRLYVFLVQILPFENPYLERLYLFLKYLQNKIGREEGEDLAAGILSNINMESYRLQKGGDFNIHLKQGAELKPQPAEIGESPNEPDMDYLSNIVKHFNERFGTNFTNEDKVRKMTADLMKDVIDDKLAVENISASLSRNDVQNAQITFIDILKEKMINHIDSNFEVFKEYNDNPEFRAFLSGIMFQEMLKHPSFIKLSK